MTALIIVIVCCLAAAVGVPVIGSVLRDRDFKKQVSGKRAERKYDKNTEIIRNQDTSSAEKDMQKERDAAWLKSKQNLFGPK